MVLATPTGSGKRVIVVSQVYRLIKSGFPRRVQFLADRRALAAQAVKMFAAFESEPNQKSNATYSVVSQWFKREDFAADERPPNAATPTNCSSAPLSIC